MLTLVTGKFTFLLVAAGDTSIVQRTAGLTLVGISGLGVHDTLLFVVNPFRIAETQPGGE